MLDGGTYRPCCIGRWKLSLVAVFVFHESFKLSTCWYWRRERFESSKSTDLQAQDGGLLTDGTDVKPGVGLGLMLASLWLTEPPSRAVKGELKRRTHESGG